MYFYLSHSALEETEEETRAIFAARGTYYYGGRDKSRLLMKPACGDNGTISGANVVTARGGKNPAVPSQRNNRSKLRNTTVGWIICRDVKGRRSYGATRSGCFTFNWPNYENWTINTRKGRKKIYYALIHFPSYCPWSVQFPSPTFSSRRKCGFSRQPQNVRFVLAMVTRPTWIFSTRHFTR